MKLFTFWRSSAAFRVRIAANLKKVPLEYTVVSLMADGGQHLQPAYRAVNPSSGVPSLETDAGEVLTQSLAIIEYLDERFPEPPLLPGDAIARAHAREIALHVVADVHPLNTPRIMKQLAARFGADDAAQDEWIRHWIAECFSNVEALLARMKSNGRHCLGDAVTLADVCLVPQVFNAQRFKVDMAPFPLIAAINEHCMSLPPFALAHPSAQPDAPQGA